MNCGRKTAYCCRQPEFGAVISVRDYKCMADEMERLVESDSRAHYERTVHYLLYTAATLICRRIGLL